MKSRYKPGQLVVFTPKLRNFVGLSKLCIFLSPSSEPDDEYAEIYILVCVKNTVNKHRFVSLGHLESLNSDNVARVIKDSK